MRAETVGVCALLIVASVASAGERSGRVAATAEPAVRDWARRVERLLDARQLAVRTVRDDTMIAGRRHERLTQLYRGVPVWGGELAMQSDASGPLTVFGDYFQEIELDTTPRLRAAEVERLVEQRGGHPFGRRGGPELMVLPLEAGGYRLVYRVRTLFAEPFAIRQSFYDAGSGALLREYDDLRRQAAGIGTGVLGDRKKISVTQANGSWQSNDKLRPPAISTYDFRFNLSRFYEFANSSAPASALFRAGDFGSDDDNDWTDGALVDAHVYAGYTYDYYYKRFGRHGLDNADITVHSVTHPFRREDWRSWWYLLANAMYVGEGIMFYGDGLPYNVTISGQHYNYMAGALDIVAHELTHGVTEYSSGLVYQGEPGALDEAFSDIMATGVEFAFQPEKADYLLGEDVVTPGGGRSMQNPMAYGDPDHYSVRYIGRTNDENDDYGGVHTNSGIANHAFYLAIEGGRHRLGATVEGVGAANREQIERVFYRGFTAFLTPLATFAQARAATLQAARELYGAGSPAERAVTQAWNAVGVN
jgi:bacillolysin